MTREHVTKETVFKCPLCKEESTGIGHVYKELRICDNCYCDIKGMQKVNSQTIMA